MKLKCLIIFNICLLLFSCKHEPPVLEPIEEELINPITLKYTPKLVEIALGANGQSNPPEVTGQAPFSFVLTNTPSTTYNQLTIDSSGIVHADSTLTEGDYICKITVISSAGSATFDSLLTVRITNNPTSPSNLVYVTNNLTLNEGEAGVSVIPQVEGTNPMTFSLLSTPSSSNITIDTFGRINVTDSIPIGNYSIDVTVTNLVDSVTFSNAYSIDVVAAPPSNLSYAPNSMGLINGNAGTSVVPTIEGSQPITFTITTSPSITEITIDNQGVISASGNLANGTYNVNVHATNMAGTVDFANIYTVVVSATIVSPTGLFYSPNSLSLEEGNTGSSVAPSVSGTTPMTFSFSVSPSSAGITIDPSSGVISVGASAASGTYSVSVTATNIAGSNLFTNAYSINVTALVPPSNLSYPIGSLNLTQGTSGSSLQPTINGSTPITFSITVSPLASGITIDPATGVVSSSASVTAGTYFVTVIVTNAAGSETFIDIFTINVTASLVSSASDIMPIMQNNCGSCHTPGGSQTDYTNYANASGDVNVILDRIQRAQGSPGFMPKNGTSLTQQEINLIQQWLNDGLQP